MSLVRRALTAALAQRVHCHDHAGSPHRPWSLVVLELSGGRISSMTHFLDTDTLFPRFGLPAELRD